MPALPIDPVVFDVLTWLFVLPGAIFLVIGGLGMITMPDVFARMHPAGIIDTLGAELILVGLMFQAGLTIVTIKLVLILAFIFFTSPTATHALARACLNAGVTPKVDEEKSAALSRGGRS
ncbi:MAG: sodium:proton antiporter [Rhodospirillales bacterium CG15_BIG_FIL_POST_REV_8_21_14_020_66_15]|nr:MAG: sodium:proton antiporter [Rhodospirillales bacterium CG15_BIG_FIL_POST_REV_8_21_14_020_66_15]